MGKYEPLMAISGGIGLISFSFLLYKVYSTQNTKSFSIYWLLGNFIAIILSIIYGVINDDYGIYAPSGIFLLGTIYLLFIKFKTEYIKK